MEVLQVRLVRQVLLVPLDLVLVVVFILVEDHDNLDVQVVDLDLLSAYLSFWDHSRPCFAFSTNLRSYLVDRLDLLGRLDRRVRRALRDGHLCWVVVPYLVLHLDVASSCSDSWQLALPA